MIRIPEIRLIDEKGEQLGVMNTREAQRIAQSRGLDLVEVAPTSRPPVCKIMDYGKFRYEQSKKERQARKNQGGSTVKEVKYHVNVEEHDYETKMRHIRDFLAEGHRIKCTLIFRGRENAHKDLGFVVLQRVANDLQDVAKIDQSPNLMGRFLTMVLAPKPGAKAAAKAAEAKKEEGDE